MGKGKGKRVLLQQQLRNAIDVGREFEQHVRGLHVRLDAAYKLVDTLRSDLKEVEADRNMADRQTAKLAELLAAAEAERDHLRTMHSPPAIKVCKTNGGRFVQVGPDHVGPDRLGRNCIGLHDMINEGESFCVICYSDEDKTQVQLIEVTINDKESQA